MGVGTGVSGGKITAVQFNMIATDCNALLYDAGALQQLKSNSTLFSDSDTDALALLRTWITQPGYPLLNVSEGNAAEQARFYAWGDGVRTDTYTTSEDSTWFVPLQVGPLASAPSVPLQEGGGLATAGSDNAGTSWIEILQQVQVQLNDTTPVINKAATRYFRCAMLVLKHNSMKIELIQLQTRLKPKMPHVSYTPCHIDTTSRVLQNLQLCCMCCMVSVIQEHA